MLDEISIYFKWESIWLIVNPPYTSETVVFFSLNLRVLCWKTNIISNSTSI